MRRTLSILAVLVNLVPALAVAGLWVRSRHTADVLAVFVSGGRLQCAASHRGRLYLFLSGVEFGRGREWSANYSHVPAEEFDDPRDDVFSAATWERRRWGFRLATGPSESLGALPKGSFGRGKPGTPGSFVVFATPHVAALALLAVWPARRVVRAFKLTEKGRCPLCGYDLRASPERCPECGTAVAGA